MSSDEVSYLESMTLALAAWSLSKLPRVATKGCPPTQYRMPSEPSIFSDMENPTPAPSLS